MNHEAFLAAICAHPEDDLPRLVYADWLEENDDPDRAAFIRAQIEGERAAEDDPRRWDLEDQTQELLARHERDWAAPLRRLGMAWCDFRRGFALRVQINAQLFLDRHQELFRHAPVREVAFFDAGPVIGALARCPGLAPLTGLILTNEGSLGNQLGRDGLRALARSPHLGRIELLEISEPDLDTGAVRPLFESQAVPRLASLTLTSDALAPEALELLAALPQRSALTGLVVSSPTATGPSLTALLRSPHLPRLARLEFSGGVLDPLAVAALVHEPGSRRVRELRFHPAQEADIQALAHSPNASGLLALDLSGSVGGRGLCGALAGSPLLARLRYLRLRECGIGPAGALALAQSQAPQLITLDLGWNSLGDAGAQALARADFPLRELSLAGCALGEEGGRALADSPHLQGLARLTVSHSLPRPVRACLVERFGRRVHFSG